MIATGTLVPPRQRCIQAAFYYPCSVNPSALVAHAPVTPYYAGSLAVGTWPPCGQCVKFRQQRHAN